MNSKLLNLFCALFILISVVSCSDDDEDVNPVAQRPLVFNLTWDNADVDLDLVVTTPGGTRIDFSNTTGDEGILSADCSCDNCSNPLEVIGFTSAAASGDYEYFASSFGACTGSNSDANFTLTVVVDGTTVATQTGSVSGFGSSDTFTYTK